jgi:hypothetical protein
MTKKLMLLAAGALTALAFAALPAGASAEEMEAHCSLASCEGLIVGGVATLSDDSGTALGRVSCNKTTGTVVQAAATSKTVTTQLTFEECKEAVFGTECRTAHGAGKITTNVLTGHLITVTKGTPASAGILLTGINVTFECPIVGVKKRVTGNIIGTFVNPQCGEGASSHELSFTQTGPGQQTHKTYTGATFDLTSGPDKEPGDDITTSSQTGNGTITYQGGAKVTITC